ncbi:Metal-dependent hydrolase, endonuclease/exonuclease/phosphatase family [bacterium A37T11]|nr:Metal-dependent hydrolase, endonuclease/exonuclease/phosphatase family [bacterium A37T11]
MNRRIYLLNSYIGIFCLLFACDAYAQKKSISIKVMTYNTHSGHQKGIESIANVIKAADPDVVALEEIERNTEANPMDFPAELAKLTGMSYYYFAKALDLKKGDYGNAILSKYPISDEKSYPLSIVNNKGGFPRSIGIVKVKIDGKKFYFAVTHLDHKGDMNRLKEVEEIREYTKNLRGPIILAGDFNSHPDGAAIKTITQWFTLGCINGDCGWTAPAPVAKYTIDYVMYAPKNAFSTEKYDVIHTANSESDHFPVLATFQMR